MARTALIFCMALLVGAMLAFPALAQSNQLGAAEYSFLQKLIAGTVGTTIGLLVTFYGLWTVFVKGQVYGLLIVIIGCMIIFGKEVYTGVRAVTCPIANSLGAACGGDTAGS